jgi:ABC-type enterochelin transport system permease subunit
MPSGFAASTVQHGPRRFLGRLLGGEARPIVKGATHRVLRVGKVTLGLIQPVGASLHVISADRFRARE